MELIVDGSLEGGAWFTGNRIAPHPAAKWCARCTRLCDSGVHARCTRGRALCLCGRPLAHKHANEMGVATKGQVRGRWGCYWSCRQILVDADGVSCCCVMFVTMDVGFVGFAREWQNHCCELPQLRGCRNILLVILWCIWTVAEYAMTYTFSWSIRAFFIFHKHWPTSSGPNTFHIWTLLTFGHGLNLSQLLVLDRLNQT